MREMDGIELQRRIRLEHPKLPVIFISAHHDEKTRRRALDDGAVGFLYKPFDGVALLEAIKVALTRAE
jgi:DNA-binding response OmpR family regulator